QEILEDACATPTKHVRIQTFPTQSMSCESHTSVFPEEQPHTQIPTTPALPPPHERAPPTDATADDEPLLCPTPTKHVRVRTFPVRRRVPRTKSDERQTGDPNSTVDDGAASASSSSSSHIRRLRPASERRKVVLIDDSVALPSTSATSLLPPSPARTPTSFFTRACEQPPRSAITLIDEARIPFLKAGDGQNESLLEFLGRDSGAGAGRVSNRHLTWQKLLEAALSLRQLHEQEIVHGRLQCRNILITADEQARVRNFGAHFRANNNPSGKGAAVCVESSPASTVSSCWDEEELESVRWRAPECLADGWDCSERGESKEADVFSLGMCILEAVTGAEPWGAVSDDVVPVLLLAGRLPSRPAGHFRDDQWELIERMCAKDPARRLGLSLVIKKLRAFAALEQDARVALQREAPRVLYATS
ncbi:hypothetical protein PybrP1_007560, partial [[Pythium] brassicae (nom. inval.)]